jgi:hypothetical protein
MPDDRQYAIRNTQYANEAPLSLAEYLQPLTPYLPAELISPAAFSQIQSIARTLPGTLAYSLLGFECRLGEDAPVADFLLSARAAVGGREALAGLGTGDGPALPLPDHAVWQQVRAFAMAWADPRSPLYEGIDNIWLEFDVPETGTATPVPSVFVGFQTTTSPEPCAPASEPAALPDVILTQLALQPLLGRAIPALVVQQLVRCFTALPPGARVAFVGAMLARHAPALRLIINGMSLAQIAEYLPRVGWPGSIDDLLASSGALAAQADYIWLNIDVGEKVYPKVGLECYYRRQQPQDEPRWGIFLDHLVAGGFCTAAKCAGLLRYPGISYTMADAESWPTSLRLAAQILGPAGITRHVRGIHHIKLVYQPDCPLEAKGYLCAYYE